MVGKAGSKNKSDPFLVVMSVAVLAGCPMAHVDMSLTMPAGAREVGGTLSGDEVWDGEVVVAEDLLVPRGRTLRISPGTRVRFRRADTSRTEPEFLDNATELLVRGRIVAEGAVGGEIVFEPAAPAGEEENGPGWGGVIFDGGEGRLVHCSIMGAERGVVMLDSSPLLRDVRISGVRHGVAIHGDSRPRLERVEIASEEEGVSTWRGSAPELTELRVASREKEGLLAGPGSRPKLRGSRFDGLRSGVLWAAGDPPPGLPENSVVAVAGDAAFTEDPEDEGGLSFLAPAAGAGGGKIYRGESFIGRDETWEGEVLIDGTVMVAPGKTLTVRPGTIVSFAFRDTNGDGIGESGIFIQGRILADGERDSPVVFAAAEGRGPGLWGAINIMGSDADENRLANCIIESSYRGLHSHFSSFRVEGSLFRDNYRALQFQESRALVRSTRVTGNSSALRFRDSTVSIEECSIDGNISGIQALRSTLSVSGSFVSGNLLAGLHLREAQGTIDGNTVTGNAPGLRASEGRILLEKNTFAANGYGGVQLRSVEAEVRDNTFAANAGNGFSSDSPSIILRGNSFLGNMRYALENNSPAPVDAAGNFWGVGAPAIADLIFDGADDPRIGPVLVDPPLTSPPPSPGRTPRR